MHENVYRDQLIAVGGRVTQLALALSAVGTYPLSNRWTFALTLATAAFYELSRWSAKRFVPADLQTSLDASGVK